MPSVQATSIKEQLRNREDGRKHDEFRKMSIKLGVVTQVKGSAYIEMGDTKVICSVHPPREIHNKVSFSPEGELFVEFKYALFATTDKRDAQLEKEEQNYSSIMKRALEPAVCRNEFPNFQIDIYVRVLDDNGSALAAAIIAASLALANASVPMKGIVTAVTAGIHDDLVLYDLTVEEEKLCSTKVSKENLDRGIIMQAMLSQYNQITEPFYSGNLDCDVLCDTMEALQKASENIHLLLQETLLKYVNKTLEQDRESKSVNKKLEAMDVNNTEKEPKK
ncbi:hypothetical protein TKK_0004831 [Trichogramma kaykai]|uniref:Exoribonuclease phosphorolytic domain-containing protein n=1 Tax=Trichogramma kaykai TaxID=54128 RepID=A0ABD2XJT7_9HYME